MLSEATYMCILPIVVSVVYLGVQREKKCSIRWSQSSWKWMVSSTALAFLYICMTSVTEVLKGTLVLPIENTAIYYILKSVLLVLSFVCVLFLLIRIGENIDEDRVTSPVTYRTVGRTKIYVVLLPMIFLAVFCISGCYPGVLSSDTAGTWSLVGQAIYTDWHPFTYVLIIKVIQRLFGNPYPLVILQMILWMIINQYAVRLLEKYSTINHGDLWYLFISVLMICNYRALDNIEKDTLWNMSLFLFCLCVYEFIKCNGKLEIYSIVLLLGSGCLTASIRHMGCVVVVVTLLVVAFVERKKSGGRKAFLFMMIPLVFQIVMLHGVGYRMLACEANPSYVKYTMPMVLAGAVTSEHTDELDEESKLVLEQVMPLERWAECYDKYYADTITRPWGEIGGNIYVLEDPDFQRQLLKLDTKFLLKYPKTMMKAWLNMTSIVWEMGTPTDGYEWMPTSIYSDAVFQYTEEQDFYIHANWSTVVQQNFLALSDTIPVWNSICWRGGFAFFVLLFCIVSLIYSGRGKESIAILPAIILIGILFLANPSQDPRYINSLQMLIAFFPVIVFSKKKLELDQVDDFGGMADGKK